MVFKKGNIPWNKNGINIPQDVWKRIDKRGEDECWEWTGYKDKEGYGRMGIKNKLKRVHRLVYEQTCGSIPDGLFVLHKCNNPPCCNPKHLYIGTALDNNKQCRYEGRQNHPVGRNAIQNFKLKEEDVLKIQIIYSFGQFTQEEIGKIYGVDASTISRIVNNKIWKHLLKEE